MTRDGHLLHRLRVRGERLERPPEGGALGQQTIEGNKTREQPQEAIEPMTTGEALADGCRYTSTTSTSILHTLWRKDPAGSHLKEAAAHNMRASETCKEPGCHLRLIFLMQGMKVNTST